MRRFRNPFKHEDNSDQAQGYPFRHIVVALDGSAFAEQALPQVEALARRCGSTITLLRAVTPLEAGLMGEAMARPASSRAMGTAVREDIAQYNALAYLSRVQQRLARAGLTVRTDCPEGSHAEAIVSRSRTLQADLIAMTTHGLGGIRRAFLGSVADEVVRSAPCPVLLVRPGQAPGHR
jgi:nucleotide-binding universal stress UspA family protein